jgi:hypothetical protein
MTTEQIQYLLENEYIKLCIDYKKGSWGNNYINEDQTDNNYIITFKLCEYLREKVELKVIHYAQYLDEYKLKINNDLEFLFESKEKKIAYLANLHSKVIEQLISVQKVIPDSFGNNYPNLAIEFLTFEIEENSDIENTLIDLFFTPTIEDILNDWINYDVIDNTKVSCDWFSNFINYKTKKFNILAEERKYKNRSISDDFMPPFSWQEYYVRGYSNKVRSKVLENARDYQKSKFLKEKIAEYETDTITNIPPTTGANVKLKWLGTPSQFGIIINELVMKGYLEFPARAHRKNAEIFLSFFDIDTTHATLSKELSTNTNSMSIDNARKLVIIHKDKLT